MRVSERNRKQSLKARKADKQTEGERTAIVYMSVGCNSR